MLLCHYFHTGNITSKRPSYVVREKVCRYVATIVKLGSTDPIFCILVGGYETLRLLFLTDVSQICHWS